MTSKLNKKRVVVCPIFYKPTLSDSERLSLKHLHHYLGNYDIIACAPQSLKLPLNSHQVHRFPDKFFKDTKSYSSLLLSKFFYEVFAEFEYMLIYQLDCLVFSDKLNYWCDQNYDYIGAPWIGKFMEKRYDYPDAVGNGGFSLRKINSLIHVIELANLSPVNALRYLSQNTISNNRHNHIKSLKEAWSNTAAHRSKLNEDRYWAFEAKKILPNFSLPSVSEALRFSFETSPAEAYKINDDQLPFGCHAWERYDSNFWQNYLLK